MPYTSGRYLVTIDGDRTGLGRYVDVLQYDRSRGWNLPFQAGRIIAWANIPAIYNLDLPMYR